MDQENQGEEKVSFIAKIFVFIYSTFLNKTTVSSATGSGVIILGLMSSLQKRIEVNAAQIALLTKASIEQKKDADDFKKEINLYVDQKVELNQKDTNAILNLITRVERKVDQLDERLYDSKNKGR